EAAEAGAIVPREVWQRSRTYWEDLQNKADGGWCYVQGARSSGSMTVAGIASLTIVQQMLRDDAGVANDGTPPCCKEEDQYPQLERGIKWLGDHFHVNNNPGSSLWNLYYVYGIERAGRLSGRRFFGEHDWYREGAEYLLRMQSPTEGTWQGVGPYEDKPV